MSASLPLLIEPVGDNHYRECDGLSYEDFVPSRIFESSHGRTIAESDCIALTVLLGIESQPHINRDYAQKSDFGDLIVEHLVTFAFAVGIHSRLISGRAAANMEFDEVKALIPVKVGDTIYVSSEVVSSRESRSRHQQGIVKVKLFIRNQKGETVMTGTRTMLVWKRDFGPGSDKKG